MVASDLADSDPSVPCKYEKLDVTDRARYEQLVKDHKIDYIVHLAAIISSLGEKNFDLAYDINVNATKHVFDIARAHKCQVYLPSSIAVFGGDAFNKDNTSNDAVTQPKTIYGVSKVFNEQLGEYMDKKFGVDFRCLRYPGVISSANFGFNGTAYWTTGKFELIF